MLDNISKSMAIKIQHQSTEIKNSENHHSRATRPPVLCNTARVVQHVQKNGQLILSVQGLWHGHPCCATRPVLCNQKHNSHQLRRATRPPVLCNTARVAERVTGFSWTCSSSEQQSKRGKTSAKTRNSAPNALSLYNSQQHHNIQIINNRYSDLNRWLTVLLGNSTDTEIIPTTSKVNSRSWYIFPNSSFGI